MTRSSSLPALCIRISSGVYGYSGRDEVDRQLPLGAVGLVVELEAEREVLAVLGVADLVGLDDVAGEDLEQPGADLGGVDVDVLDLLLDVLLFVGQVLVDVAVALDVGLRLQQGQRLLDLLPTRPGRSRPKRS